MKLHAYASRPDVLVLGLSRGGVPVAFEIARAIRAPLDVMVVRKLGVPGQEELAMGAIASGGARVLNTEVVNVLRVSQEEIDRTTSEQMTELERRELEYRDERPPPGMSNRTVILVDDGLATGSTMQVAVLAVRRHNPSTIVVAAPVGSIEACAEARQYADEVVCAETPQIFYAVGQAYQDFSQTTDEEVRHLLSSAAGETSGRPVP
jgi:putative phosphoribosyl transferase